MKNGMRLTGFWLPAGLTTGRAKKGAVSKKNFRRHFIHRDRTRQGPGTSIGNIHLVKESLDLPILTKSPMETYKTKLRLFPLDDILDVLVDINGLDFDTQPPKRILDGLPRFQGNGSLLRPTPF